MTARIETETKLDSAVHAALALMSDDASDAEALAVWCDPATHQHIRDYLARTVRNVAPASRRP